MDVDVVCELTDDKISSFIELFDCDFYISEPAVRDAVGQKSCFNLIHMPTSFKIDIFVSRGRPFDTESMQRASSSAEIPSRRAIQPGSCAFKQR